MKVLTATDRLFAAMLMAAILFLVIGCADKKVTPAPAAPPAPSFTGQGYLRGTIGSLVRVRDFEPQTVSGFGLVILPPGSGTGSSQVPPFLRQRLINEMRTKGLGSSRRGTKEMTPSRVLADRDTVIVTVYGFVPPGAVAGSRFDVVVSALNSDTDTTSLAGGRLWTTDLAPGGANVANRFIRPVAEAGGAAYINPFDHRPMEERKYDYRRRALIVAGGKATTSRPAQLVLNQPSWSRSRLIADRIIARFGKTTDARPIAEPETDLVINLNIPDRYAANPLQLIDLIQHLYVKTGGGFEAQQARRLALMIEKDPNNLTLVRDVLMTWKGMGRAAMPVLREYYASEVLTLRLSALKAGAWLGDQRTSRPLVELTQHETPAIRVSAVESLVDLPRNLQAIGALKRLLDDEDGSVRIAAYETLAANNDPLIERIAVENELGVKYLIDRVPSSKPLIYITPRGFPRLAIFQPQLALKTPSLAALWDNQLMLRVDEGQPLGVYYKPRLGVEAQKLEAVPTVATLAYLLGHKPSDEAPQSGLDLTFGQVADVMYWLCQDQIIPAPIQIEVSPLARLVDEVPQTPVEARPETAPPEN